MRYVAPGYLIVTTVSVLKQYVFVYYHNAETAAIGRRFCVITSNFLPFIRLLVVIFIAHHCGNVVDIEILPSGHLFPVCGGVLDL